MFIGSEPAYQTALKHDGKLFLDGTDSKVFVVSPLSLLPLLSLVAEAWKQFQLTDRDNIGTIRFTFTRILDSTRCH